MRIVSGSLMVAAVIVSLSLTFTAEAKEKFAKKEKKECVYCHLVKEGGEQGFRGLFYKANKLSLKGFVEKTEAAKAGVKAGVMGMDTKPTKKYTGKLAPVKKKGH